MKFILPSALSLVILLVADTAKFNGVYATSSNNIFGDNNNSGTDVMSRVFVRYKPGHKTEVAESLGISVNPAFLSIVDDAVSNDVYYDFKKLESFVVSVPASELEYLRSDPNVLSIEEDHPRFLVPTIENDSSDRGLSLVAPFEHVPYGVDMVEARDIWDADRDGIVDSNAPTGANRKICIIDTGFEATHEDLSGPGINVDGYNGNLPWNQDGHGHGTHVAGTIAAVSNSYGVVGVTPGTVQLYIVRVFGNDGKWTYSSDLIDAANRCASAEANIISMSLGGVGFSETEQAKFDELNAQGILSIAAAGNNGFTSSYFYPASYSSVMSVAAVDSSKTHAEFSNRNIQVDISAPGVGVLSTVSDSGYAYLDGTSMAAPHVSGVAALVWSAIPNLTNTEVRDALIATAEDLGTPGRDDMYGAGLVQANKALTYLYDTPFPTLYPTSIETPTDYPTAQTSEAPTTKPLTKKPTIKSKSSKLPKLPK
jgi:serine protease